MRNPKQQLSLNTNEATTFLPTTLIPLVTIFFILTIATSDIFFEQTLKKNEIYKSFCHCIYDNYLFNVCQQDDTIYKVKSEYSMEEQ